MIKKVILHIGFLYLLTEVHLFTLILLEFIPQEISSNIKHKSITHNTFRIQGNKSIMSGFYCITLIEYMLAVKTLLDYTNLFSPNDYKKMTK